jgi:hypothetical protein
MSDKYTIHICEGCERECTSISKDKSGNKPKGCHWVDEFVPTKWRNPEED